MRIWSILKVSLIRLTYSNLQNNKTIECMLLMFKANGLIASQYPEYQENKNTAPKFSTKIFFLSK
jgi:hypothetical protein